MPERFSGGFNPEDVRATNAAFDKASGKRDPEKLCATTLRALAHE